MSEGLFSTVQLEQPGRAGYRLHHLEVLNWGTFHDTVWRFTPGSETTLLTGDIGSGKSTLVDALTTLLLPANKIAYNKAAGANTRERTLRSYVEGYYKSERTETTGRSKHVGLRSGKATYSVILGVFVNEGYDEAVTLAQVFWQHGSVGQPNRFYVSAPASLAISTDFADFGSDLNALRKQLRAGGAAVVNTFPEYGRSLRRLLGIRSEQALDLFHQTVSMKSVGNLDDFVREHMLEPSDTEARIDGIIGHFENLSVAHDTVTRARDQLAVLAPIAGLADEYDASLVRRESLTVERGSVRVFVAEMRSALLERELAVLQADSADLRTEQGTLKEARSSASAERDGLIEERAQGGGNRIGELERLAAEARSQAERRGCERARFDAAVAGSGLAAASGAAEFDRLKSDAALAQAALDREKPVLDNDFASAIILEKECTDRAESLREDLTSLQSRDSNLPRAQVDIRAQLCADTGVSTEEVPFAGELIDVADGYADWRGAAERVLRPFALSLLVPQQHYDAISAWVNENRLVFRGRRGEAVGGRLVYHRIPAQRVAVQAPTHAGLWLYDCLQVRDGPLEDYVRGEMARRADFVCATTLSEFRAERRAVTQQGQVRSGDRHEKDDRHRIDDPSQWVLGWVNEHKIAALESAIDDALQRLNESAARRAAVEARRGGRLPAASRARSAGRVPDVGRSGC